MRPPERPLVLVLACLSALLFYGVAYGSFNALFGSLDFNGPSLFEDFTGPYLQTAQHVLESGRPSDGFYYPPFFAIVLAALPGGEQVPVWIWLGVQVLSVAAVVILPFLIVRTPSRKTTGLYVLAALTSYPLLHNFHWGQVSTILIALLLGTLVTYQRGRRTAAAILFAIAISIKVYPLLLLPVFVIARDWRFVLHVVLWTLFCSLAVPFAALGIPESIEFLTNAFQDLLGAREERWSGAAGKQFLPAVVARWFGVGAGRSVELGALHALCGLIYLAGLYALHKRRVAGAVTWGFVFVFLCTPLLLPTSWPHYFAYLPFCQLFLLVEVFDRRRMGNLAWGLGTLLIALSMFAASMFLFRFIDDWETYARHGYLLAANLALFAVTWAAWVGSPRESATAP